MTAIKVLILGFLLGLNVCSKNPEIIKIEAAIQNTEIALDSLKEKIHLALLEIEVKFTIDREKQIVANDSLKYIGDSLYEEANKLVQTMRDGMAEADKEEFDTVFYNDAEHIAVLKQLKAPYFSMSGSWVGVIVSDLIQSYEQNRDHCFDLVISTGKTKLEYISDQEKLAKQSFLQISSGLIKFKEVMIVKLTDSLIILEK